MFRLRRKYWCRYLGAKIQYGHVPLFTAGDDTTSKRFRTLHGVQRHMIDINKCRMLFDGNEEEYEEFYDYPYAYSCLSLP